MSLLITGCCKSADTDKKKGVPGFREDGTKLEVKIKLSGNSVIMSHAGSGQPTWLQRAFHIMHGPGQPTQLQKARERCEDLEINGCVELKDLMHSVMAERSKCKYAFSSVEYTAQEGRDEEFRGEMSCLQKKIHIWKTMSRIVAAEKLLGEGPGKPFAKEPYPFVMVDERKACKGGSFCSCYSYAGDMINFINRSNLQTEKDLQEVIRLVSRYSGLVEKDSDYWMDWGKKS